MLNTLPESWEILKTSLAYSSMKLSLVVVRDSILNEALASINRGRSKSRCPKRRGKSISNSQSEGAFKYFHCGKEGHMKRNCRLLKRPQREESNKKDDGQTSATMKKIGMFSYEEEVCTLSYPYIDWIINSAASRRFSQHTKLETLAK